MTMTLVEALPGVRFSERHTLDIDAPLDDVWDALTEMRWGDLRLTTPLLLLRGLGKTDTWRNQRLLDGGPVQLMCFDAPHYVASAQIGRPWQLRPELGPTPSSLEELAEFRAPNWLKYGMDFTLDELPSGRTRVVTTTLCEPTDESARRHFHPYWTLIRPFSGLIRREILHTIARKVATTTASGPPPGQRILTGPAPRFGLPEYLNAHVVIPENPLLHVGGDVENPFTLDRHTLDALPETTQALDLHCVMTWSSVDTQWTGWRFTDVWSTLLQPHASPGTTHVHFTGLDGFASSISLRELLRDDVMIAHSRDGHPLAQDHDAPYRLVVPQLYGYKHVKHLSGINLSHHHARLKYEPWIMHRVGRVDHEERFGLGFKRLARLITQASIHRMLRRDGVRRPTVPQR